MKRQMCAFLSACVLLLTLAACGGTPTPMSTPYPTAGFQSGEESIRHFTVSPEGEVWAVTDTVKLGKYQTDGTLTEDYGIENYLMCLHYYDGKGFVNYDTAVFRHVFDTLFGGGYAEGSNPLFPGFSQRQSEYDLDLVTFRIDLADALLSSSYANPYDYEVTDKWRVLPIPKMSEEVDSALTGAYLQVYAIINPNSQNKESAIAYLEAFCQEPKYVYLFLQEGIENYEPYFDTASLCFQDIYGIFDTNLALHGDDHPTFSYQYYVDYQAGRMSLDEAVASLQREAEMWLGA